MLIKTEFDIQFELTEPTAIVAMLHLHPSLCPRVLSGDQLFIEQVNSTAREAISAQTYLDTFGNHCTRFVAPAGRVALTSTSTVAVDDEPDQNPAKAHQAPVQDLPSEVLQFLLPSRYCEVDEFTSIAHDLFGQIEPGWPGASAIRDWVHDRVAFDYKAARPTKTAMDVFNDGIGVCRDFQHLAITLCRSQNIPARYATGYLGDIRAPYGGAGDFSAWYEVFLDNRWIAMDARHHHPRHGRVLMATGRDAADVAITTSFGSANLVHFYVEANEVLEDGTVVPALPAIGSATPLP